MRRRDEDSFVEFATSALPRLRSTAYLLCGDWHLASDHAQDGLLRVYVAWPRLRRTGGEYAYARRAVTSAFLDARRKRSSTEVPAEPDLTRASSDDVAGEVSARQDLLAALAALPPRQRACVVLRYFDDLSVAETATVLNCSEGNVKSQTARGLATLRSRCENSPIGGLVVKEGTN